MAVGAIRRSPKRNMVPLQHGNNTPRGMRPFDLNKWGQRLKSVLNEATKRQGKRKDKTERYKQGKEGLALIFGL